MTKNRMILICYSQSLFYIFNHVKKLRYNEISTICKNPHILFPLYTSITAPSTKRKRILTYSLHTNCLFLLTMSNQNLTSTPMDINNNTQDTYQGAFEIFSWGNTHSTLSSLRPPSTRIPPAGGKNSAFLDLSRMPTGIDGREIASNLP